MVDAGAGADPDRLPVRRNGIPIRDRLLAAEADLTAVADTGDNTPFGRNCVSLQSEQTIPVQIKPRTFRDNRMVRGFFLEFSRF